MEAEALDDRSPGKPDESDGDAAELPRTDPISSAAGNCAPATRNESGQSALARGRPRGCARADRWGGETRSSLGARPRSRSYRPGLMQKAFQAGRRLTLPG